MKLMTKQTFLILLLFLNSIANGDELVGIQATVEPSTINAQNTKLRLFGSIRTPLDPGDYFLITLPKQVSITTDVSNQLQCQFLEPENLKITSCQSISSQIIQIVVAESIANYFQFDILQAITNPPSTSFTDSLKFETYRENKTMVDNQTTDILITATKDRLSGLSMQATVSQNAGDKNTLEFAIRTNNPILSNGMVQVQFPFWFEVPSDNVRLHHLDVKSLQCMDLDTKLIISCQYNQKTRVVSLTSLVGSAGRPSQEILKFSIKDVFNPISTDTTSILTVSTTDEIGGIIDQSQVNFRITKPNLIQNAVFKGDSSEVQDLTNYTLQFSIGVPLYQGNCPLTIFLPYPDFRLTSTSGVITDVQGIGLFGSLRSYQYEINPSDNSILIKDGCSQGFVLPQIPATIYILGLRNPEVSKLTDPISIKLYNNGQNGQVAILTPDRSPTFQITTGPVTNINMTASSNKINALSDISLQFMFKQQVITDSQSISQNAKVEINFGQSEFKVTNMMAMTGTTIGGGLITIDSINETENSAILLIQNPQIRSQVLYQVDFSGFKMAGSKQTMGPIIVRLSRQWYTNYGTEVYYPINIGNDTGMITTQEGKFLRAEVSAKSYIVFSNTTYKFDLLLENPIPRNGYIQIDFPSQIIIQNGFVCNFIETPTACTLQILGNQTLKINGLFQDKGFSLSDGLLSIEVTNIRNPRSTRTTDPFYFRSYDFLGQLIDVYKETNTAQTMIQPLNFTLAKVNKLTSLRVSDTGVDYTFDVALAMDLSPGDYLTVGVPVTDEIKMPEFPLTKCLSPQQQNMICTQSVDKTIKVTLSDAVPAYTTLSLTLSPFTNPSSGRLTGPFRLAAFDKDGYSFAVTEPGDTVTEVMLGVQMRDPYIIKENATLVVNTDVTTSQVAIIIYFFVKNPIMPGSKLIVNYPQQVGVNASAISVTSPQSSSLEGVRLVPQKRQVVGDNFFSVLREADSFLQINLNGFTNPSKGQTPTDPFTLDLLTPEGLVIDRLESSNLTIQSRCDYPCKDCSKGPSICDSCLSSDLTDLVLLQEDKCVQKCQPGYYQVANLYCYKCNPSCATCDISPNLCTSCPLQDALGQPAFLFNNRCVSACDSGYFRNDQDKICEQCVSPCKTCDKGVNECTSCKANYYLYRGTCREKCPEDYFINNGTSWQCDRCINNCQTCQRTVDQCMSCLPGYRLNLLNSTCFIGECPEGVTTEETPGVCSVCKPKCGTCGQNNTGYCLTCAPNLFLTPDNDCVVQCNSNQAIMKGDDGLSRCQPCKEGCAKCLDGKPNHCQTCETGLVNFNFSQCLTSCPLGYMLNNRSGNCLDGRTQCKYGYALNEKDLCELIVQECLEGYILNNALNRCIPVPGFYVPFPILGGLTIITLIFIASVKCGRQKSQTKLIPCIIILWSFFEIPFFAAQVYLAADFGHEFNIILTCLAIFVHFPVNYYAVRSILPPKLIQDLKDSSGNKVPKLRRQVSNKAGDMDNLDQIFKHWAHTHRRFLITLRCLALCYNHKFLRCLTCQFNGRLQFMAVYENQEERYNRPMLRVAFVNMALSYLLVSIADVTALKQIVFWGYQFTVICIESLVFICFMSILEIVDWYLNRGTGTQYFKVTARGVGDQSVYGEGEDPGLKRQRSFEHHVNLLKQLNEELEQRKAYSGNYDKLSEYCKKDQTLNETALRAKLKHKMKHIEDVREENEDEDENSESSDGCLSTQNHYVWNKQDFFEYNLRNLRDTQSENGMEDNPNYREGDWVRKVNSLISETDYGDPQRLLDFREELDGLLNDDAARSKTLDYKASFHILDPNPMGISESELEACDIATQAGNFMLQRPPKHNLIDVMGHFETDLEGNFVLIKKLSPDGRTEWLVDALGRMVNKRGYLIDDENNIVNKFGEMIIQKDDLDSNSGDIPADVFADLFIPRQVSREEADPIFRKKPRVQTGKQRPNPSLIPYNKSGEGSLLTRSKATRAAKASKKNILTESRFSMGGTAAGGQADDQIAEDHHFDSQMYILQNDHSKSHFSQHRLNSASSQKTLHADKSRYLKNKTSSRKKLPKNADLEHTDGEESVPHNRTIDHGLPSGLLRDPSSPQISPGKDLVNLDVQPEFEKMGRRVFSPKKKKKHRKIQMSKQKQAKILEQQQPLPFDTKKKKNSSLAQSALESVQKSSAKKGTQKPGIKQSNKITPLNSQVSRQEKLEVSDLAMVMTQADQNTQQNQVKDAQKQEDIKEKQKLDAMIQIISKHKEQINKAETVKSQQRPSSLQKRLQYQPPQPKRRQSRYDTMLQNGLFFVKTDLDNDEIEKITQTFGKRPMSLIQDEQQDQLKYTASGHKVQPTPGFMEVSQNSQNQIVGEIQRRDDQLSHRDISSSNRYALDQSTVDLLPKLPTFGTSKEVLVTSAAPSNKVNLLQRGNESRERNQRVSLDRFYRDRYLSPSESFSGQPAVQILTEGRHLAPSVSSIHHHHIPRQPNKVSGAYKQDLTKLLRHDKKTEENGAPEDDPFVQLKRIFNKK